jgi:hypothetical protein
MPTGTIGGRGPQPQPHRHRGELGTETVTETETVGGEVRKEQIEFDTTEDSTGRSTNRS